MSTEKGRIPFAITNIRCLRSVQAAATRQELDPETDSGSDSETDGRRILTKIDLRVLPILTLAYLLAFLDRVNIGQVTWFLTTGGGF